LTFTASSDGIAWALVSSTQSRAHGDDVPTVAAFKESAREPFGEAMAAVSVAQDREAAGHPLDWIYTQLEHALLLPASRSDALVAVLERYGWSGTRFFAQPELFALHEDIERFQPREGLFDAPTTKGIHLEGDSTCRRSGLVLSGVVNTWTLFGCHLLMNHSYTAYVYLEGNDGKIGVFSGGIAIEFLEPRETLLTTFLELPNIVGFDRVIGDTFTLRFAASTSEAMAWAIVVDEGNAELMTEAGIIRGDFAVGGAKCRYSRKLINDSPQTWPFSECGFLPGRKYSTFVYVASMESMARSQTQLQGTLVAGPVLEMPLVAGAIYWTCHGRSCPGSDGVPIGMRAGAKGLVLVHDVDNQVRFEAYGFGPGEAATLTILGPVTIVVEHLDLDSHACHQASLVMTSKLGGTMVLDPLRKDVARRFCGSARLPTPRRVQENEVMTLAWQTSDSAQPVSPPAGWRIAIFSHAAYSEVQPNPQYMDRNAPEGKEYRYQVRARGRLGLGEASMPSFAALAVEPPAAPITPFIVGRSIQGVALSWGVPFSGGRPIDSFVLYQRLSASDTADGFPGEWTEAYFGYSMSHTFRPEHLGQRHDFAVSARNPAGEGPFSGVLLGIHVCARPAIPQGFHIAEQDMITVKLEWATSHSDGGCPLLGFELELDDKAVLRPEADRLLTTASLHADQVLAAKPGSSGHRVTLRARNSAGLSGPTEVKVNFAETPLPVQGMATSAHSVGGVQLKWEPVPEANSSGLPVTAYRVYIDRGWGVEEYRAQIGNNAACDVHGGTAHYSERIIGGVRNIITAGCPNHFSGCQKSFCDGTVSDAMYNATSYRIPAAPILLPKPFGSLHCTPGALAVALNGVPIFGSAPSSSCSDPVEEFAEAIDVCGGRADARGIYRYEVPPSCLLVQLGATEVTHSPQIGWSLDGFPVYGPFGPLGVAMEPCGLKDFDDATPCLDECGGLEGLLPDVDAFLYRYYMPGSLGDLKCSAVVDGNRTCGVGTDGVPCCIATLPDHKPFGCYRGCTQHDIDDNRCVGGKSGVSDLSATHPITGVLTPFDHTVPWFAYNTSSAREPLTPLSRHPSTSMVLTSEELRRLRALEPSSPDVCFRVAGLNAVSLAGHPPQLSRKLCIPVAMVPSAPRTLRAIRRARSTMLLTWEDAGTDPGHLIISYEVFLRSPVLGANWSLLTRTKGSMQQALVEPCVHGALYAVRIRAQNDVGWGSFAETEFWCAVAPSVLPMPDSPSTRVVRSKEGLFCEWDITWVAPRDAGGAPVSYRLYRSVRYLEGLQSQTLQSQNETLLYEGAGLKFSDRVVSQPAHPYAYSVTAANEAGDADRSAALELVCAESATAPLKLNVSKFSDGVLTASWPPSSLDKGAPPQYYELSTVNDTHWETLWRGIDTRSGIFEVEKFNKTTTLVLSALNPAGLQHLFPESETYTDWHPDPWMRAPTLRSSRVDDREVSLEWTVEKNAYVEADVMFELQMADSSHGEQYVEIYKGRAMERLVEHLACGTDYLFRLRAVTAAIASDFSEVLTVRPCSAPTVPMNLQICQTDEPKKPLSLTWKPPMDAGGSPVTQYQLFEDSPEGWRHLTVTSNLDSEFSPQAASGPRTFIVCAGTQMTACGEMATMSTRWALAPKPPDLQEDHAARTTQSQAALSWETHAMPVKSAKVYYAVEGAEEGSEDFVDAIGSLVSSTTATVGCLVPGKVYRFRVAAMNRPEEIGPRLPVGGHNWSEAPVPVHAGGAPIPPQPLKHFPLTQQPAGMSAPRRDPLAVPLMSSINVVWDPPAESRGLKVLAYELQHDDASDLNFLFSVVLGPQYQQYQMNGLNVGSRYLVRLRVRTTGGWSEFGPTASFLACAQPSPPRDARVAWSLSGPPELSWQPPLNTGGIAIPPSIWNRVQIEQYRIWLHLPDAAPYVLVEVPGTQNSTAIELPFLYDSEYMLYVTASNAEFESNPSNSVALLASAPPGQSQPPVGTIVDDSSMFISWKAPAGIGIDLYELYWDVGLGGPADQLVYKGSQLSVTIANTSLPLGRDTFHFRVRSHNPNGWSLFSEVAVVSSHVPDAPLALHATAVEDGAVTLAWAAPPTPLATGEAPPAWYELHVVNLATLARRALSTPVLHARLHSLETTQPYRFTVRGCTAALCGPHSMAVELFVAERAQGLTAPRRVSVQDGVVTIAWSGQSLQPRAKPGGGLPPLFRPPIEGYVVKTSTSPHGPYAVISQMPVTARPELQYACRNESNGSLEMGLPAPTRYFKVAGVDDAGIWPEGFDSQPTRVICAALPAAPAVPEVSVSLWKSNYSAEVKLVVPDLDGAHHTGWRLLLSSANDSDSEYQEVILLEASTFVYTFAHLVPAQAYRVRYAAISSVGVGALSDFTHFRALVTPREIPTVHAEWSSDSVIALAWHTGAGLELGQEVSRWHVYVDWRDGKNYWPSPEVPAYDIPFARQTSLQVDCTDVAKLGGMSRARQVLWFRVAAVNEAGVGLMSDVFAWRCSAAPSRPVAPVLAEIAEEWILLRWTTPDLHGAKLLAIRVHFRTPHMVEHRTTSEQVYNAPQGDTLNITGTNFSQPCDISVQVLTEVGESQRSPWLALTPQLALPPLPPLLNPIVTSSTDEAITVAWMLDRSRERGTPTLGWYVYVSIDGTTWPAEGNPTYDLPSEQLTSHTQDCTLASVLGGQSRSQQFLWFKVAAYSSLGRGALSGAVARRCSAPPGAPPGLSVVKSEFNGVRSVGAMTIQWGNPDDHGAVVFGYKIYGDEGNKDDTSDIFRLLGVITDAARMQFTQEGVILGRTYKYRVAAVSEAGEGQVATGAFVAATVPSAPVGLVGTTFADDKVGVSWNFLPGSRILGGLPLLNWRVYTSATGGDWSDSNSSDVALLSTGTATGTADVPCTQRTHFWVRVAGVNSLGAGEPTESLHLFCARQAAYNGIVRVDGTDDSITIQYSPQDYFLEPHLDNATLLGFTIAYREAKTMSASAYTEADWWAATVVTVPAHHRRYTATGLKPGWPYAFKVISVTETGLHERLLNWRVVTKLSGPVAKNSYQIGITDTTGFHAGMPLTISDGQFSTNVQDTTTESVQETTIVSITSNGEFVKSGIVTLADPLAFNLFLAVLPLATLTATAPQAVFVSGGNPYTPARPEFVAYFNDSIQFRVPMAPDTKSSKLLGYEVYVSTDGRSYEWFNQSTFTAAEPMEEDCCAEPMENCSSSPCFQAFVHDCRETTKQLPVNAGSVVTKLDRRSKFVYAWVVARTESGPSAPSRMATFFCGPPPEPPIVEFVDADEKQVTLQWKQPELYGAPLLGYKIYIDDGRGGDMMLARQIMGRNATLDYEREVVVVEEQEEEQQEMEMGLNFTNDLFSVYEPLSAATTVTEAGVFHYSLRPLAGDLHYRVQVSVVSGVTESKLSAVLPVQTCRRHMATARIVYQASDTEVGVGWDPPNTEPLDCPVYAYQVIQEYLRTYETMEINGSVLIVEVNNTAGAADSVSRLISPTALEYVMTGLVPEAGYRFKVRTHTVTHFIDSLWVNTSAAGHPSVMTPKHAVAASSPTSIALAWKLPDMNLGSPVGFEVFRDDGPDTLFRDFPDTTCLAPVDVSCNGDDCSWAPLAEVPAARLCTVPGLQRDKLYRFRTRALNEHGTGPLSPIMEMPTGTLPFPRRPELVNATYENCTMTFQWEPALDRGMVVHSYLLKLRTFTKDPPPALPEPCDPNGTATNCYNVPFSESFFELVDELAEEAVLPLEQPASVWTYAGSADQPFMAMQATVNANDWPGLTPGGRYHAALAAVSSLGTSGWSEYSAVHMAAPYGYCFSAPATPKAPERDTSEFVRAGNLRLAWEAVNDPSQAGGDDPLDGKVVYNLWGRPCEHVCDWRDLATLPTHEDTDGLASTPPEAVPSIFSVDTSPETPHGAVWTFKLRIGNRAGFSAFSEIVALSSGTVPGPPRSLGAAFSNRGRIRLFWAPPEVTPKPQVLKYEVKCGDAGLWTDVENIKLSHTMASTSLPLGAVECQARAVNAVGAGPAAATSVTIVQPPVQVS